MPCSGLYRNVCPGGCSFGAVVSGYRAEVSATAVRRGSGAHVVRMSLVVLRYFYNRMMIWHGGEFRRVLIGGRIEVDLLCKGLGVASRLT